MDVKYFYRLGVVLILVIGICFLNYIHALGSNETSTLLFALLGFAAGYVANGTYNKINNV